VIHREHEAALAPRRKELAELARGVGTEPGERAVRHLSLAMALVGRQSELARTQGERRSAESLLRLTRELRPSEATSKPADDKRPFDEVMKHDPELQPLMSQIGELTGQMARYTALYKDNPDRASQVIKEKGLQAQIDALYALGRTQYEKKLKALG